jgi:ribonuclease PH
MRSDNRSADSVRPITVQRPFLETVAGSVLISAGNTRVLCSASISEDLPPWRLESEKGWLTAEYRMLPASTSPRSPRRDRTDGRATEIQRLIGRSLRAVADLESLGPRMITVDCDVLQADGGTRTLAISGAMIVLIDAVSSILPVLPPGTPYPLRTHLAAVSVGVVEQECLLDLDYREDSAATVDMNLVMTGEGEFVEIQGSGEEGTFSESQLGQLLSLGKKGIGQITEIQKECLKDDWPFASSGI